MTKRQTVSDCDNNPRPRAPVSQGRGVRGPTAQPPLTGRSSRARYTRGSPIGARAAHVPVSTVLAHLGLLASLKRSGRRLVGSCPIHNGQKDRRHFVVSDDRLWRCFGDCNRGGTVIELVAALERCSDNDAIERIATWFALSPLTSQRKSSMTANNRPSHKVLGVTERADAEGESKSFFSRIGSAWSIKDGKGLSIILDALPLNGKLVVLEFDEDDDKPAKGKKQ